MTEHWTDLIVGDRMTVDQAFAERVDDSEFSRQQWGLIMTAVEFEIDSPDDETAAALGVDTSNLPAVMSELDAVDRPPGGAGRGPGPGGSEDNLVTGIKDALGLGGGSQADADDDRLESAERLTTEYAEELQTHLEERGKWAEVREAAAERRS